MKRKYNFLVSIAVIDKIWMARANAIIDEAIAYARKRK
jgi:hypothetical protein